MAGHSKWANIQHRKAAQDRNRSRRSGKLIREPAVALGEGTSAAARYEPVRCEGYGPGGVAVMVDCLTDDRSRTVAEVRHALSRHGGNLGAEGSVGYLFNEVGLLVFAPGAEAGRIAEVAIDAGAEDVIVNPDASIEVLTAPGDLNRVRVALAAAGLGPAQCEITFRASATVELAGGSAEQMVHLIDELENLDDVQYVYSNAAIPNEILARV